MCAEVREREDSTSWCEKVRREVTHVAVCVGGIFVKIISLDLIENQFLWT